MNASVLFHGFKVPLIGVAQEETLQQCQQCNRAHDLLQVRLCMDGRFLCDTCAVTAAPSAPRPPAKRQNLKPKTP